MGCHPLREVPSLRGKGSTSSCIGQGYLLLLQSGHGHWHWSQAQLLHALRIMDRFYRVSTCSPAVRFQTRKTMHSVHWLVSRS